MKIGIDASLLNPNNMSGTQYFLYYLIKSLSSIDANNKYEIYCKYKVSTAFFTKMTSNNLNFSYVFLDSAHSWTQVSLSKYLFSSDIDVLVCPWQTIPVVHPKRVKIVSIIHDFAFKKYNFGPTIYTSYFSDIILAVSNYTKKQVLSLPLLSTRKVSVINEGVDLQKFKAAPASSIRDTLIKYKINSPYILFVGYMVPRKNIKRTLQAFDSICRDLPEELNFILAGKISDECADLQNFAKTLNNSQRVRFLGFVPDEDLPSLISGASLMSYISLTEGFGLPVLEANACGVPVITSNTGALPEVSGDAALLVDPYDIDAISKGMKLLIKDSSFSASLKAKGTDNVKRFAWNNTAQKVLDILNNAYEITN